jgi:hypothetical protein
MDALGAKSRVTESQKAWSLRQADETRPRVVCQTQAGATDLKAKSPAVSDV